jgi:hypothetical protein
MRPLRVRAFLTNYTNLPSRLKSLQGQGHLPGEIRICNIMISLIIFRVLFISILGGSQSGILVVRLQRFVVVLPGQAACGRAG